tara:strand:- start:92382 stop:93548 length:1167 start_codon:yes stop_codon:yes gene_type:complete
MSKTFALILIFILGIEAQAQTACTNTMTCKVVAPSGMRMRSEASLKSKVVVNVPKDSVLSACTDKFAPMSYENINGYWRKVKYKGSEGYMFDGFLEVISINKSDKITYEDIKRRMDSLSALPDSLSQLQVVKTDGTAVETLDSLAKIDSTEIDSLLNKNPEVTSKKMDYTLLTEAYNYCGDVQKIDPGMVWYGIYPKDDETEFYRIKRVELEVLLSRDKIGKGLEFDIQTNQEERSVFLLGFPTIQKELVEALISDNSEVLRFNSRKVFPGQEWQIAEFSQPNITLSATGSVVSAGPCPELSNYKLLLKGEKYSLPVVQDITEELDQNGQCGMPEIYWYGDLNGDKIPEIIFVSVYEDRNQFTLFISDPTLDNVLLRKGAEWIITNCN